MATTLKVSGKGKGFARVRKRPGSAPGGDGEGGGVSSDPNVMLIYTKGRDNDLKFTNERPPKVLDHSGFEGTYNEVARPDRQPLLRRNGQALRKISMTFLLAYPNIERSINDRLEKLEKLARTHIPLLIEYDDRTKGTWHITSLTYQSVERNSETDDITRAEVSIEFTETPVPTDININDYSPKKRPKYYTVKKNDTLAKIAQRFYGTDSAAIVRAIAKVNDIDNPKHIKAGRKIKLP